MSYLIYFEYMLSEVKFLYIKINEMFIYICSCIIEYYLFFVKDI